MKTYKDSQYNVTCENCGYMHLNDQNCPSCRHGENKTMSQHTPTPWKIERSCGDIVSIGGVSGNASASDDTDLRTWLNVTESDAEFIVTACNAHYDLINALSGALEYIEGDCTESKDFTLNLIKDAIKKAGGKV